MIPRNAKRIPPTDPAFERRWISAEEASIYLGGLHSQTVFDLCYRGILPSAKIGGSRRIDRRRLDEFMEAQVERGRTRRRR